MRSDKEEIERIRELIRGMSRDSLIYKVLKEELSAKGYWKNLGRGKPDNRKFGQGGSLSGKR